MCTGGADLGSLLVSMLLAPLVGFCLAATPLDVVKSVASDRKSAESSEKLADKLEGRVDFEELSRRALGDQWKKLDKARQVEFVATMRALLRANWLQKLLSDERGGGTKYGAERVSGDEAQVDTAVDMGGEPLPIVYHLHKGAGGEWRIFDIVTDGASLVELYQQEFLKQLARDGYDGMLRNLKTKVAQLERSRAPATNRR